MNLVWELSLLSDITVQLEDYKVDMARLQQDNTQLDEDTKVHYRQFTQNRANIER